METGLIPDHHITASNYTDNEHQPEFARLGNGSFWRADASDVLPWIQVSFDESMIITAVALRVMRDEFGDGLVQTFRLEYTQRGQIWQTYNSLEKDEEDVRLL